VSRPHVDYSFLLAASEGSESFGNGIGQFVGEVERKLFGLVD